MVASSIFDSSKNGNTQNHDPHPVLSGKEAFHAVFSEHLDELIDSHPRKVVIKEVNKMLDCGNPKNGTMYICPDCGTSAFVPFTCKSRICPSCGNLYNMQRCTSIGERILNVQHRHWVFTVPQCLRHYFESNWFLLNVLFDAASETVRTVIKQINPYFDVEPGMVLVLHTFGRANNFVPHVHGIVTDGGLNKYDRWWNLQFLNFDNVRLTYQDILLQKMSVYLGPSFAAEADELKKRYPNGFVVSAPDPNKPKVSNTSTEANEIDDFDNTIELTNKDNIKRLIKYTARYIGRPAFACSRLDSYDGQYVTYHYTSHLTNETESRTVSALEFMKLITQHIPESNFRMVRYFGIYNRSNKECMDRLDTALNDKAVSYLYSQAGHKKRAFFSHWRGAKILRFNIDPLKCSCCSAEMEPVYVKFRNKYFGTIIQPASSHPKYQSPPPDIDISGARADSQHICA